MCVLAKCCHPLPGINIVGILTKRKIISVHDHDCRHAQKEEKRWVPVTWKETFSQMIKFYVEAEERSGLLAELLHTIATAGFEAKEAKAKLVNREFAECSFKIVPKNLEQLQMLVTRVSKVRSVMKIHFE